MLHKTYVQKHKYSIKQKLKMIIKLQIESPLSQKNIWIKIRQKKLF